MSSPNERASSIKEALPSASFVSHDRIRRKSVGNLVRNCDPFVLVVDRTFLVFLTAPFDNAGWLRISGGSMVMSATTAKSKVNTMHAYVEHHVLYEVPDPDK